MITAWVLRYKMLLLNIGIGLAVFYMLGAQFTKIGFHNDDYGLIRHGTCDNLSDVQRILKNGDIMHSACFPPENLYPYGRPSCLEVIYRPLLLFIMGGEFKAFGLNPYATHLIHIGFHTVTTLVLFNVLAIFTGPMLAALCSLFFAFHSSLKDYFFWQCYIQNSLEGFFLILLCLFTYLFYRSRQRRWLILGSIIFFTALLLRETLIIMPLLVMLGWFLYTKAKQQPLALRSFFSKYLLPYTAIPLAMYTLLRCWAYPFNLIGIKRIGIKPLNPNEPTFMFLRNKFFDLVTYFFDLIGLKWIPSGYMALKLLIIASVLGVMFFLWKKSTQHKPLILFLCGGILLSSWPSIAFFHSSRYLYLPVLFLAAAIGLLLTPIMKNKAPSYIVLFIFTIFVGIQGGLTIKSMSLWSDYNYKEMLIHKQLATLSHITNKRIITIGIPEGILGTGTCSGPIITGAHSAHNYAYCLLSRASIGNAVSIATLFKSLRQADLLHIPSLEYTLEANILRIRTPKPECLWFLQKDLEPNDLGDIEIVQQDKDKITEFLLYLDTKKLKNAILLGWQHSTGTFQELIPNQSR